MKLISKYQEGSNITAYKDWLDKWLRSREDVFTQNYNEAHPYKKYIPGSANYELNKQLRNMRSVQVYYGKKGYDEIQNKYKPQGGYVNTKDSYEKAKFNGTTAFQNSKHNYLYFTKARNMLKSAIHELTHSLSPNSAMDYTQSPQDIAISKILLDDPYFKKHKEQVLGQYHTKDKNGNETYRYTPDEVYARLMQVRHDFNMDPKHVWTKDEVHKQRNKWISKYNYYQFDPKYISDEVLTRLLNEVAYNNEVPQNLNNNLETNLDNLYA